VYFSPPLIFSTEGVKLYVLTKEEILALYVVILPFASISFGKLTEIISLTLNKFSCGNVIVNFHHSKK
jgi:hypothetical protein